MKYFSSKKITTSITSIIDLTRVRSFLIEGNERAILIDTGTGVGNLREFIQSITNKPLTVICTHGHPDHVGGANEFEEVYLSEKDFDMALYGCSVEKRKEYARFILGEEMNINNLYFVPQRTRAFQKLEPEMSFDLGGITVRTVEFPGHTRGMMVIWIPEERSVILGDACNRRVFLFSEESSSISEYKKTCIAFQEQYMDFIDICYMSHGPETLDVSLIQNMIDTCEDILEEKDDRIQIDFMGEIAYLAKREIEPGVREDGKIGNIAYALHKK